MIHELKTWVEYFAEVIAGNKPFELRKKDRDFKVGDTLRLQEYDHHFGQYTGNEADFKVTYILPGGSFGVMEGYCVLGIKPAK